MIHITAVDFDFPILVSGQCSNAVTEFIVLYDRRVTPFDGLALGIYFIEQWLDCCWSKTLPICHFQVNFSTTYGALQLE